MRIHLMRAVKNKLSKGSYALMLTQYDSIGGHPLSWSHLAACGIGSVRPGITRIIKHPGRYFDRILRFEDSVFALCPPRPYLRYILYCSIFYTIYELYYIIYYIYYIILYTILYITIYYYILLYYTIYY
jgi:hypothetical protein